MSATPSYRLNLFLREPQYRWLEQESERLGIGMAELIRRLIDDAREEAALDALEGRVKAMEGK